MEHHGDSRYVKGARHGTIGRCAASGRCYARAPFPPPCYPPRIRARSGGIRMTTRPIPHTSHWGAFDAEVRDGRLVGVTPFAKDPDPSAIIHSIPDMLYDESRIAQPMVRRGWLERGPAGDDTGGERALRGGDAVGPVAWEKALELVAAELERVRAAHGNTAIFAGSYGWWSAG